MARAIALKSKAGYTCAVVPQFRSDEMLAKREESIYETALGQVNVNVPIFFAQREAFEKLKDL